MKHKKDFDFGKRAEKYDYGFEGRWSKKFYTALLSQITPTPYAKVLDVGCGTGYMLKKMHATYKIMGYGIDIESNMIDVAQKQCPEMNIQVSACEQTPFEAETFDMVTTCMAYHHFTDQKVFAREAFRILKKDGFERTNSFKKGIVQVLALKKS